MAIVRAIDGNEDGTGTGTVLAAARSGAFGWECQTAAGVGANSRAVLAGNAAISDTSFEIKARIFVKLPAYPSANDVTVCGIRDYSGAGTDFIRLEMNTVGACRMWTGGSFRGGPFTTSYGVALELGKWYRIELRLYGYAMSGATPGRAKGIITIYNDETGAFVSSFSTLTQTSRPESGVIRAVNGSTMQISISVGQSGWTVGWVTLSSKVAGLAVNVLTSPGPNLPAGAGVGIYTTFPSEDAATAAISNSYSTIVSNIGTFKEQGTYTLFNEDIDNFYFFSGTFTASLGLLLGQVATTPTHSRQVYYDDSYIEVRTGANVTSLSNFTQATHIYGFIPTGQGPDDAFAPAGAFGRVDEIPPGADVGGDEISSATNGATSTYTHAALFDVTALVHHVRVKINGASPGGLTHAAMLAGVAYPITFSSTLLSKNADPTQATDLTNVLFDAMTFGVRNTAGGDTFRVNQVMLEVLMTRTQPTATIIPDRGPMLGGNTVTVSGAGFISGMTVLFDGVPGTSLNVLGPTSATVVVPGRIVGGRVDVEIDVPQLYPSVLENAYKYLVNFFLRSRRDNSPIDITDVLNEAPNTCTFTMSDAQDRPKPKQEMQMLDRHGNLLFGGIIQDVEQTHEELTENSIWKATATDYTDELNRFRPYGSWSKVPADQIVEELFERFAPDFSTDFLQTGLPVISITCSQAETMSAILSRICKLINGFWRVDYYKRLKLGRKAIGKYAPPGPGTAVTLTRTTNIGAAFPNWSMYTAKEQYKTSFLFEDGTESLPGVPSAIYPFDIADSTQGLVKQEHFSNIPIGPSGIVARLIHRATTGVNEFTFWGDYLDFYPPSTLGVPGGTPIPASTFPDPKWVETEPIFFSGLTPTGNGGWSGNFHFYFLDSFLVDDNTTTAFDLWDTVHPIGPPTAQSPSSPYWRNNTPLVEEYIPAPIDPEPPDTLDLLNTTLLNDPPLRFILDGSQQRTRIIVRGASTRTTKTVHAGDYYWPLEDMSIIKDVSNVQVMIGGILFTVLVKTTLQDSQAQQYFQESAIEIIITEPGTVHPTFPAGTEVFLWAKYDDLRLQQELAATIDDPTLTEPGVIEGYLSGDYRTQEEMITAAKADLNMFGRPIQGVTYATLDTKTASGKTVLVDLPLSVGGDEGIFDPNIFDPTIFDTVSEFGVFGEFLIQDVRVSDIDVNDEFVAKFTVTASAVRYTLYDLLQRVLVETDH